MKLFPSGTRIGSIATTTPAYEGVTDAVHNKIGLRILQPGQAYETRLRTKVIRQ